MPHAYTLLMVYHTACILLAMPFLNKHSIFPHEHSGGSDHHQQTRQPNIVNQATAKLGNSAQQICSLGRSYRQVYGSFRLSAITPTHCTLTAAVALLRIYPDGSKHGANSQLQDDLTVCLEVLDELSVAWNVASKLRRNLVQLIVRWRSSHDRKRSDEMTQCPSDNVAFDLGNTTGTSQSLSALHSLEANPDHMPLFPGQLLPPFSFNMENLDLVPDVDWDKLDFDGFLGTTPQ
ncbi:transcriptional regulator family: Fungal Specific TF [Penicillium malachiteum]|uniref:Transcriptional regulator family: Fungal Specific TF n=1 Tax=Penicillium malachiteum TaxID=1324776 RepID=A0AAD6MQ05_9EURO|nr:transcriptional regulator family: Fungal Specific TF [Penicillium malachiteum]